MSTLLCGEIMGSKKKFSFSPSMMVFKWIAGLIVSSIAVTGVGFVDSVIWKVAIFAASTIATTVVGALYSAQIIKSKVAGGEVKFFVFSIILFVAYLVINLVAQFAGTMPLWAFIAIFVIFALIVCSLGFYIFIKQKEKALALYYTELDAEDEQDEQKRLEEEKVRQTRWGKNKTIDLTNLENGTYIITFTIYKEKQYADYAFKVEVNR